ARSAIGSAAIAPEITRARTDLPVNATSPSPGWCGPWPEPAAGRDAQQGEGEGGAAAERACVPPFGAGARRTDRERRLLGVLLRLLLALGRRCALRHS